MTKLYNSIEGAKGGAKNITNQVENPEKMQSLDLFDQMIGAEAEEIGEMSLATILECQDVEPLVSITTESGVVTPICLKGELNVIAGAEGAGKSSFEAFVASEVIKQGGSVLVVDTEQGRHGLKSTLLRIMHYVGEDVDSLAGKLHLADAMSEAGAGEVAVAKIAKLANRLRPTLMVVDKLDDLLTDSTTIDEANRLIACLRSICERLGTTLLCSNHLTKSSQYSELSGHLGTALKQKAALILSIGEKKSAEGVYEIRHMKNRFGRRLAPIAHLCYEAAEVGYGNGQHSSVGIIRWLDSAEVGEIAGEVVKQAEKSREKAEEWRNQFGSMPFTFKAVAEWLELSPNSTKQRIRRAVDNGIIQVMSRGVYQVVETSLSGAAEED